MTGEEKQAQGRQNRLTGRWGEALVAEYLRDRGWVILASGFRTRFGELDLVAQKGGYLAFVEVKVRRSTYCGTPAQAVDTHKQHRLRTTAQLYLSRYPSELQPRFDVAEVYAPQGTDTPDPRICYIENAF